MIENSSIQVRYDHLLKLFKSKRFLNKEGLGNEVPFFICDFKPEESVEMGRVQRQLISKLSQEGVSVLHIDLYDTSIEILKERGIFEEILSKEQELTKDELLELLQNVLDPEYELVPYIGKKINDTEHDILFITGVGEVYPFIRSHNVLNNLQSTAKDKPTVMFFPGTYTHSSLVGSSLDLFGRLHDDKYYRAFNVYHCEV
ncbi:MAG: DUF1788 domain-containing protein [Bdellovibrionales bacterium CG10_big_fil_rev_8_21_14_0_10_45_34]|nr:MAG: DUF1788 domain-containing protein [Bdellovibrionales bacterium CG10_big_fil_rev_8_21_14_0_10_45_34]